MVRIIWEKERTITINTDKNSKINNQYNTVSVTTKRNEGWKSRILHKEKAASKFTLAKTTDQNEYTYTGLKQDTTFVIKAIAIGKNGKEKESKEVEIETSTVPKIDSKEIEFAVEPNTWTNKSVKVTAKPKVDTQGFTLVTSKNPTSSWTKVNNPNIFDKWNNVCSTNRWKQLWSNCFIMK